jgi:hypothetical protein
MEYIKQEDIEGVLEAVRIHNPNLLVSVNQCLQGGLVPGMCGRDGIAGSIPISIGENVLAVLQDVQNNPVAPKEFAGRKIGWLVDRWRELLMKGGAENCAPPPMAHALVHRWTAL